MPSPRTEVRSRRGWSDAHVAILRGGLDFERHFAPNGPWTVPARIRSFAVPEAEDARRRQCWADLRDEIMASTAPFHRAWAWWQYESTEPRRRLRRDHAHFECSGLFFGLPTSLFNPLAGLSRPEPGVADYESEREYLIRLPHLLTDAERALLAGGTSA